MFILSNNGKVGVYGNGDRVIGSAGTEKALIMDGATNTIVDNTVEEIHLQNNIEKLSFAVNDNTNTVSIMNGNAVVASFAANENGIKLFTANGMSVIKMVLDAQGNASFTADNGSASATPVPLPTNGSALPSDAIDTNAKSDNAGGNTPVPPVDDTVTIDLTDPSHKPIPTDGTPYKLIGAVTDINKASYAEIKNASKITIKDELTDLIDTTKGTLKDDAKAALAIDNVTDVKVIGDLDDLAMTTLPAEVSAKTVSYLINKKSMTSTVTLDKASVDEANGAVKQINDFLANSATKTVLNGTTESKLPADFAVTTVKITNLVDTAEAIANADAKLLKDATTVTVEDTVANVIAKSELIDDQNVDSVNVNDSINNISKATLLLTTSSPKVTFTANDTGDIDFAYNATLVTNLTSKGGVTFDSLAKDSTVTLDASKSTEGVQSSSSTFKLDDLFKFGADVNATVDFKGSTLVDKITAHANGGIIDGGLGKDEIILGAGDDTVVLGSSITPSSELKDNSVAVTNFNAAGTDKLDFAGFLDGFGVEDVVTNVGSADGALSGSAHNGDIVILSQTGDFAASGNVTKLFLDLDKAAFAKDGKMLIIATGSADTHVWYVSDDDGNGFIEAGKDTVQLVATLNETKTILTADNIA